METATTAFDAATTDRLESIADSFTVRHARHLVATVETGDGRRWSSARGPGATSDSPFFIASVTKRFIAALALQAHERGELPLETRMVDVLPADVTRGLHVFRGRDHTAEITIRHLATHTSGLSDSFEAAPRGERSVRDRLKAGENTRVSFDEFMRITRATRPYFAPQDLRADRQRARYTDTGFALLIRSLEAATGQAFAGLIRDRIATPLGLSHTRVSTPENQEADTLPLSDRRLPANVQDAADSFSDLDASLGDLLRFQKAFVSDELFGKGAALELWARANRLQNIPILHYGFGTMLWRTRILTRRGLEKFEYVGHSGSMGSWLFSLPAHDLTFAGSFNQVESRSLPFRFMAKLTEAIPR